VLVAVRLRQGGTVDLGQWTSVPRDRRWSVVLTSEDVPFVEVVDRQPPAVAPDGPFVTFARPSAVILRAE
jgi:hypothetical protein